VVMPSWFKSRARDAALSYTGPTSAHLWFEGVPSGPWRSVSATLEVVTEPSAAYLYFWALQASFTDASGTAFGAAHTGLQWNPRHPGGRAVNWGGYGRTADVSSVLDGTHSTLPGIPGDENTRNFSWTPGVGYQFTISRVERGWRSTVVDTSTGERTVIRELFAGGDRLNGFVVWMEIFAPCDAPTTLVRWSDLAVADEARGARHQVRSLRTSFPDVRGACTNNDSRVDNSGWLQLTNDRRTTRTANTLTID
jgi:hypothetical protein